MTRILTRGREDRVLRLLAKREPKPACFGASACEAERVLQESCGLQVFAKELLDDLAEEASGAWASSGSFTRRPD